MKRTPLTRRKPLSAHSRMQRGAPLRYRPKRRPRPATPSHRCLLCGALYAQEAHWPHAVGMGRDRTEVNLPTVYLCNECHIEKQHRGDHQTILALIEKAPAYWRSIGRWEEWREIFEAWLAGWAYKQLSAVGRTVEGEGNA